MPETRSDFGFAIDIELIANGESVFVVGDNQRVLVKFPSVRSIRRLWKLLRRNPMTSGTQVNEVLPRTVLETIVAGRTISLSGGETLPNGWARFLGLTNTRLFPLEAVRAMFFRDKS